MKNFFLKNLKNKSFDCDKSDIAEKFCGNNLDNINGDSGKNRILNIPKEELTCALGCLKDCELDNKLNNKLCELLNSQKNPIELIQEIFDIAENKEDLLQIFDPREYEIADHERQLYIFIKSLYKIVGKIDENDPNSKEKLNLLIEVALESGSDLKLNYEDYFEYLEKDLQSNNSNSKNELIYSILYKIFHADCNIEQIKGYFGYNTHNGITIKEILDNRNIKININPEFDMEAKNI